jgi:hypothetical protein
MRTTHLCSPLTVTLRPIGELLNFVGLGYQPQTENRLVVFVVHVHPPFFVWQQLAVDVLEHFAAGRGSLHPRGVIIGEFQTLLMIAVLITVGNAEKISGHRMSFGSATPGDRSGSFAAGTNPVSRA